MNNEQDKTCKKPRREQSYRHNATKRTVSIYAVVGSIV